MAERPPNGLRSAIFVSDRERRLWAASAAVVIALYSTLGAAPFVSSLLRSRGLLEPAFGLGAAAVAAAVLLIAMKRKPSGFEVGVWIGVTAVYVMALVRIELVEERTHLIEYGLVASLTLQALIERADAGRGPGHPASLAFLITAAVGTVDEVIQAFLPTRVFDLRDILFNLLAGGMAVGATSALGWARRRRSADGRTRDGNSRPGD